MHDVQSRPQDFHAAAVARLQDALHRAIDGLEPDLRSVFLLRDMEKLSTHDTARRLQLSPATIKVRLLRARKEICRLLWQQFGELGQAEAALRNGTPWETPSGGPGRSGAVPRSPNKAA